MFADVLVTPLALAEQLAAERFGIAGRAERLVAERDENFHLRADDGRSFILKITNPAEDRAVTAFHSGALQHIAAVDPGLPVPKLIACTSGEPETVLAVAGAPDRVVRLLTYMPGVPVYQATASAGQRRNLGRALARLDLALRGFRPASTQHRLAWDLQHASGLRPLLAEIADPSRRALATRFLDRFDRYAMPAMAELRTQVIHNDFQPYNVLVDAATHCTVSGIIDFGDMVSAPLINEVAVACAYHIASAPLPFAYAADLLAGYTALVPLYAEEVGVLVDLIAARMVMTVSISNWRALRQPDNREYILRNAPLAWRGLERVADISRGEAVATLLHACHLE